MKINVFFAHEPERWSHTPDLSFTLYVTVPDELRRVSAGASTHIQDTHAHSSTHKHTRGHSAVSLLLLGWGCCSLQKSTPVSSALCLNTRKIDAAAEKLLIACNHPAAIYDDILYRVLVDFQPLNHQMFDQNNCFSHPLSGRSKVDLSGFTANGVKNAVTPTVCCGVLHYSTIHRTMLSSKHRKFTY